MKDKYVEKFRNEKEFTQYIIHRLNSLGNFVWRNNAGMIHLRYQNKKGQSKYRRLLIGVKGGSDILGVDKQGKFLAIECKIGSRKTTYLQEEFIREINERGGIGLVISDRDDFEELINRFK